MPSIFRAGCLTAHGCAPGSGCPGVTSRLYRLFQWDHGQQVLSFSVEKVHFRREFKTSACCRRPSRSARGHAHKSQMLIETVQRVSSCCRACH